MVLRLLRGESPDALSREAGQPAAVLSGWRDEFLEGGIAALKRRTDDPKVAALEKELKRAKRLVGDLMMDKVWARLRHRGIPVAKERVRRLMRQHGLQMQRTEIGSRRTE